MPVAELLDMVFDFIVFDSAALLVAAFTLLPAALTALPAALTALPAALTAFAAEFTAFEAILLALAAVLVVSPPQAAIPKALKAKSVESAITFFIIELILLSSSKIKFTYFYSDHA
ncbi:MAG TPA: hypothetical protein VL325_00425 [Pyrinomonadaceae bacterium]|nr:hypothetical protein [Pyrinomonadaceae bacterium]